MSQGKESGHSSLLSCSLSPSGLESLISLHPLSPHKSAIFNCYFQAFSLVLKAAVLKYPSRWQGCLDGSHARAPAPSLGWKVTTARRRATSSPGLRMTSHPPNSKSGSAAVGRAQLSCWATVSSASTRSEVPAEPRRGSHGPAGDPAVPAAGPAAL